MVLGKSFLGQTDGADNLGPQIRLATDPVLQFLVNRIKEEAVDREIAPQRIRHGISERHLLRVPAILVIRFGSECGDLKLMLAFDNNHDAELPSYCDGAF